MSSVSTPPPAALPGPISADEWRFVAGIWLASRLLVAGVLLIVVPLLPLGRAGRTAQPGWDLFAGWDGGWYLRIATAGYDFALDSQQHSVAFLPVYPLAIRGLASLGVPQDICGVLISHASFLIALVVLYSWMRAKNGVAAARWAVAFLAWCPYSLFCSMVYTEALFLALTTAALRNFDRGEYPAAAAWGMLASGTRVVGIALVPAMLWAAWRERRGLPAVLAGLACTLGLIGYMVYLAQTFSDPLAFLHAQAAWHLAPDPNWLALLERPYVHSGLAKLVLVFGGLGVLAYLRHELPFVGLAFGGCAFALLLASGVTISIDRYVYGIVPLTVALGIVLARHPHWAARVVAGCALLLAAYTIRFGRGLWVA